MNRQQRRALNRANAAHSTGPVTAQGEQVSSQNSLKHGLTSMKAYLPHEEQDYLRHADRVFATHNPQTPEHADLVQSLIDLEWRIKRIPSLEARLFADPDADPLKVSRALDILSRHQLRLHKLVKELQNQLDALASAARTQLIHKLLPATARQAGFVLQHPHEPAPTATENPSAAPSAPHSGFVSQAA